MKLILVISLATTLLAVKLEACQKISAAVSDVNGYRACLFFGPDFICLSPPGPDGKMKEVIKDSTMKVWHVPAPDAVFTRNSDHKTYYFSKQLFYTRPDLVIPKPSMDFPPERPSGFFDRGIDAAGNFNRVTHYFKDCDVVMNTPRGVTNKLPLPPRVPCHLDAALTQGDDLWLFKGDQVWIWKSLGASGFDVQGPVKTSSLIDLNSVVLCENK